MGTIMTVLPWAGCFSCAALAASGYARMAKAGGWRDAASWHAPLIFTSGAVIALAFLGVLGPLTGAFLALAPLVAVALIVRRAWAAVAARQGHAAAARVITQGITARLRGALPGIPRSRAPRPAGRPESGPPAWSAPVRARNVPHLLEDPNLGAHPGPEEIAAGLEHAEVPVPPHWERTAQVIGDYEAEDDDDLNGHIAGEAAGVLTVSAAITNRTENLALGRGLDPVLMEAHYDIANGFAELATRYALLVRRDHVLYGDVREWRDNGGVLPHGARGWYDAGSGDGGRAA
jgi:hypothetical protein